MTFLAHVFTTSSAIVAIPLHGNLHCNIEYIPPQITRNCTSVFFIHDQTISAGLTDSAPFETSDKVVNVNPYINA